MSIYDTIRCIWHDPRYLLGIHGDNIIGGLAVFAIMFMMWGW